MLKFMGHDVQQSFMAIVYMTWQNVYLVHHEQRNAVHNWVMRYNEYNWPDNVVLELCVSLGCQLAPKRIATEYLECAISFTLMEKALLQSLSHSQFMCYGLLKIYLKEVLGSFEEINDMISSYIS